MTKNRNLTEGNPNQVIFSFCLPLFASVIFQQMYNIADSLIAGKCIGENALAAVGNSYEITLIFIAIAFGCNIGCSVITSRYFGAGDFEKMKTAISTSIITSSIICLVCMILGLFFSNPLLSLIHTPVEVYDDSLLYLNIYIWSLPFVFFYNISTGIFSALGDSKTPFLFLAFSSLCNIGMDYLFVKEFQMGVAGVAWATFICQSVSCLLALTFVALRIRSIHCPEKSPLFSFEMLHGFSRIAFPSMLQQGCVSIGNIIIQGAINGFGPGVMAGYSAGVKLNNLVITAYLTLANGISNYTSQNLGAGKMERITQGFKAGIRLVWILTVPFLLIYFLFPTQLVRFFLDSPSREALQTGIVYLRILAPFYFVVSAKIVSDGVLRGSGYMKAFLIGTFTDLFLRVGLSLVLSKTVLGSYGIWASWPIGWSIATAVSLLYYHSYYGKPKRRGTTLL